MQVNCEHCGCEFSKPRSHVMRVRNVFCSIKCRDNFQREKGRESGTSFEKPCKVCGKEFIVVKSEQYKLSTCSDKCKEVAKKGQFNGNWNGGVTSPRKSEMSTKKYKEWRNKVFERDDYICKGCSKRGGDLQADHIKSWAHHPKLRYDLDNGRTLCHKCHKLTYYYNLKRKLTDNQAILIVNKRRNGQDLKSLSSEFKVSVCTILRITKYKSYKHATSHLFGKYFPKTSEERLQMENNL